VGGVPRGVPVATDGWWPASPSPCPRSTRRTARSSASSCSPASSRDVATGSPVTGTERVWDDLQVTLVRGSADDLIAPTVRSVKLSTSGGVIMAKVDASDDSDIASIDVTQFGAMDAAHIGFTSGNWTLGPDGTYDVTFDWVVCRRRRSA